MTDESGGAAVMAPSVVRGLAGMALGTAMGLAQAASGVSGVEATATATCVQQADAALRLACYDRLHGRDAAAPTLQTAQAQAPAVITASTVSGAPTAPLVVGKAPVPQDTHLSQRWDLAGQSSTLFAPRVHKPVYLLPATWTNKVNLQPSSPSPDHSVPFDLDLSAVEAKYQLSFKSKLDDQVLGTPVSLWAAYTQSSRWQVYNGAASRPFRETNYEPEIILAVPMNVPVAGWNLRVASLSLNHQSNGRSLPLSRSWNRVIGSLAAERGEWVAEFRPWLRLRENPADDDNPDVQDYIGRGELLISRYWGDHAITFQARHSLKGGERSRGSAQVEWVFPMDGALHGFFQVFSGYGESLVDYNLRQTKVGLGVTIAGWR